MAKVEAHSLTKHTKSREAPTYEQHRSSSSIHLHTSYDLLLPR